MLGVSDQEEKPSFTHLTNQPNEAGKKNFKTNFIYLGGEMIC